MTDLIINILGWIGSLLLVTAYWLNSKSIINAQTKTHQFLNIVGSLTLMINTFHYGAYPSGSVNIVWLLMGLYHITKILNNKQRTL
ncbi:CBU_0592 family membrane protein [Psychroserpens sp.]|uniref:CBU_0592 family membrane protein n=1 Tax=Psychroserpens sp. TaxID=2020870 RepID=UPI003FA7D0DF